MQIKSILIASNNKGKFHEISSLLKEINIEAVSIFDLNIEEPEETGSTFAENALLKAKYYSKKTNLISLSDDSGLCIEDLENSPGIHSARFAINPKTQQRDFPYAFEKIFNDLQKKGIDPKNNPRAFFVCNLAIFDPSTNFSINFEGKVHGHLTYPPRGDKGFGYDPIFIKDGIVDDIGEIKTFGEIDSKIKDKISHRAVAFEKLVNWLKT